MTKVLTQLPDNAGKYSRPDTSIQISAELENLVVTSVADDEPGIDFMEQEMIFEKSYRGRIQHMLIQGTGMGLLVVRAITEMHGRKIGVTSLATDRYFTSQCQSHGNSTTLQWSGTSCRTLVLS